jgi:glutathione peroxidase
MKKLIYIIIIMFSFLNNTSADYEKIFYDFKINSINNDIINLSDYKEKTILLVNVASNCGFTKQYSELQELYDTYKNEGFVVIGVPSNQFGAQEPDSNKKIKDFCETNFNISFPMSSKFDVKGDKAHPIFLWAKKNYGKSAVPKWNFHKILINKKGKIEETYASFTKPMSKKIIKKIEEIL